MKRYARFMFAGLCTILLLILTKADAHGQIPTFSIPQQPDALPITRFIGRAAAPQPIEAPVIPEHPFMAPNGTSNIHNNAYMTDTYTTGGPLGQNLYLRPSYLGGVCVSMAFDTAGRILTLCIGRASTRLFLIKADELELKTLAYLELPFQQRGTAEFSAGGYFYLDRRGHALIPTIERTIWDVAVVNESGKSAFKLVRSYDLTTHIPENDAIMSVLPDFSGRLWFVTKGGIVGTVRSKSGIVATLRLPEEKIDNSFATDETGGVFIASDHALYRFDAGPGSKPVITWREVYNRGYRLKPGQVGIGTGTTPTLMGKEFVAITDNADPHMHVLVYRRAARVARPRLVCSEPVFISNRGATENSLIATDKSIIVENNYGYSGPDATMYGRTTTPGITRIDLDEDEGCHTVWMSMERAPNAVSKLSLQNGLIYTYTKDLGPGRTDAWYFTAIDFHTGETVFKQAVGTGYSHNSHYAGIYLGPDRTAYVGLMNGLAAIRDRELAQVEPEIPGF